METVVSLLRLSEHDDKRNLLLQFLDQDQATALTEKFEFHLREESESFEKWKASIADLKDRLIH